MPHPAELPSLDQQLDAFARRFPLLNSRTDSPTPNKKEDAVVRTEPPVSSSKAVVPAHLHITNVAIEPIKESNVSVKLSYIDDGGEDARLAHRYGIAIRETPLSFPARKELEDSMFKPLVSEVLHSPQTQITSNQLLEDTLAVTFPSAQLLDEYKTGKKNLYILGRFRYKGSKGWNHSDYCYYVGFSEKHVTLCAAHNEEPRM
ncbi:MAG TPA: hypothetical protein VFO34_17430 [Candidatus Acidoferrales bacterium]|nr:hypothetical protein [Candidatus Acidoferrales bacterium]